MPAPPSVLSHISNPNAHQTAVVKLDTNGAFTEVKIIATSDVGKQLQED